MQRRRRKNRQSIVVFRPVRHLRQLRALRCAEWKRADITKALGAPRVISLLFFTMALKSGY